MAKPFDFTVHPLFRHVKPETVEYLVANSRLETYPRGHIVLTEGSEGSRFFVLAHGSVRVFYTDPTGRQVVVKLFQAPVAFGEMECIAGVPYLESVEALEKSTALEIPRHIFLLALRQSQELTYNMVVDLAARLCIAAQNERSLAFNTVERRLATLLHAHVTLFGLPAPGGIMIRIPLSQDSLAQSLGVARRSVTRALARWTKEGLIKKAGGRFVVADVERLAANGDLSLLPIAYSLANGLEKSLNPASKPPR
ncbi:MAG: Crp/Fnr family transcriptional regulator [Myxococcaceae bacterium]|nr:Crp/Fnr family transcriptional regulator [Myxococcaceae bacterium]